MRSLLGVLLLFVVVLAFTNPAGDFPLNDDWSYGTAVRNLVERGEYRLSNWTSMPLLTQVLWGSLFCLPAGFSFTALRFSTLVLSLAALALLVLVARQSGERRPGLLLLGPLVLMFNPVYLALSQTFMTDVPFMAFTLGSLCLLILGVDRKSTTTLLVGMLLALLATLLRQTGFLIPVAFGIGYLSSRRPTAGRVALAAGFVAVVGAALLLYGRWLATTGRLPTAYDVQTTQVLAAVSSGIVPTARQFAHSLLITFTYLGLFTLPIGLFFLSGASKKRLVLLLVISAALLALTRVLRIGFVGNILSDRGVGPFTLAPASFAAFTGSAVSKAVFGLLALVGGTLLLEMLRRFVRNTRQSWTTTLCLSFAALYFVSTVFLQQLDRYMLLYLPLLAAPAALELRQEPKSRHVTVTGLVVLILYAVFSVTAVHDYLAWNRVRWQALHHLTAELSVTADHIDGGFEFNGLYTYDENYIRTPGKSFWWVKSDDYVVAFDTMPGYALLRKYPVRSWLPAAVHHIYLLKRTTP